MSNGNNVYEIPLEDIEVSPLNVRHEGIKRELDELSSSIKILGLLQPVVLRGEYGNPPYELFIGQRRFEAHKKLEWKTIKAIFRSNIDSTQTLIMSLVENMQRVELNHADVAKAVTGLYKEFGKDDKKVAQSTGLSLPKVREYIDIHESASESMKTLLKEEKVEPVDIKRALKAAQYNIVKAEQLLNFMVNNELTGHQKSRMVEYGKSHKEAETNTIIEESMRPRVERKIIINLSDPVRTGLDNAVKALSMDVEEISIQAIEEWLTNKGFSNADTNS